MHRLSTSYPHLIHRVTNRVIHRLWAESSSFAVTDAGLREAVADLADVVGQIGIAVGLLGDFLNRIQNRAVIPSEKRADLWQTVNRQISNQVHRHFARHHDFLGSTLAF